MQRELERLLREGRVSALRSMAAYWLGGGGAVAAFVVVGVAELMLFSRIEHAIPDNLIDFSWLAIAPGLAAGVVGYLVSSAIRPKRTEE